MPVNMTAGYVLLYYVLPGTGAVVLLLAIVALLKPREHVLNSRQSFSGFGVTFEVSFVTLLFVLGTGLLSAGVVVYVRDMAATIVSLSSDLKESKDREKLLALNHLHDMQGRIELSHSSNDSPPNQSLFKCTIAYSTSAINQGQALNVWPGINEWEYGAIISDVPPFSPTQPNHKEIIVNCNDKTRYWQTALVPAFETHLIAPLVGTRK
jgi:hypothetical protein